MHPLAIAAAPAVVDAAAGVFGGNRANRMARNESRRNRKFQERMRNTQWQSAVADMRAAGVNPALAYSKGPNAAPGGSVAQQSDSISPALASAKQSLIVKEQLKQMQATTRKLSAEARSAGAGADLDEWRAGRLLRLKLSGEETMGVERLLQAELGRAEGEARYSRAKGAVASPLASIADAFLPIVQALSQMSAGGYQRAATGRGMMELMKSLFVAPGLRRKYGRGR